MAAPAKTLRAADVDLSTPEFWMQPPALREAAFAALRREAPMSFQKEFERDGRIVRTAFLNRRHIASVRRLIARVEEYLDAEADRVAAAAAAKR